MNLLQQSVPRPYRVMRYASMDYESALVEQKRLVAEIWAGRSPNLLLLLEHPPVYTIGRSGDPAEVLAVTDGVAVAMTDRGGRVTYHGPGQLVAYVLRDLRPAVFAVREHVYRLEQCAIDLLAQLGIEAWRESQAPGVWVAGGKIGAVGVRIRQGIAYHGLSLNRAPNLDHFANIIPCGITNRPVVSLASLGVPVVRAELEELFLHSFAKVFAGSVFHE